MEFKRSRGQCTAAAMAVCGMLNGQGGYVASRSTQHDLSDLQRALLDVLGQRGPLGLSDIEKALDTEPPHVPFSANSRR